MSNVVAYPSSASRIDAAIDNVFAGIRRANLESHITRLSDGDWEDLIMEAVMGELRAPLSGFRTVLKRLRKAA